MCCQNPPTAEAKIHPTVSFPPLPPFSNMKQATYWGIMWESLANQPSWYQISHLGSELTPQPYILVLIHFLTFCLGIRETDCRFLSNIPHPQKAMSSDFHFCLETLTSFYRHPCQAICLSSYLCLNIRKKLRIKNI